MNKIDRNSIDKPQCLVRNTKKWTKDLIIKRQSKPDYWYWHQYEKEKVEHILTKSLSEISHYHCSYCGIYPLKQNVGGRSIDHFKPKSEYLELAFEWTNLFIACSDCQSIKGSSYPVNIEPLKPDSCHYHFDYWFKIDWTNNYIVPNTLIIAKEQNIAQSLIDWLGLNYGDRPQARFDELEKFNSSSIADIWKWSYPYFLERGKE